MKRTYKRAIKRLSVWLVVAAMLLGNVGVVLGAVDFSGAATAVNLALTPVAHIQNGEYITAGSAYNLAATMVYGVNLNAYEASVASIEQGSFNFNPQNPTVGGTYTFTVTFSDNNFLEPNYAPVNYTLNIYYDSALQTNVDNGAISAARYLIETASYSTTQAILTEAQAQQEVQNIISGRNLPAGVGTFFNWGVFTPATSATAQNPNGIPGSLPFTVTLTKGSGLAQTTDSRILTFTASSLDQSDVDYVKSWLTWDIIKGSNTSTALTSNLALPANGNGSGKSGVTIEWAQVSPVSPIYIATNGTVTFPMTGNAVAVTMRATIRKGGAAIATKDFTVSLASSPDQSQVNAVLYWLQYEGWNLIRGSNAVDKPYGEYYVYYNLTNFPPSIPTYYNNISISGVRIDWRVQGYTSSATINTSNGVVTFPTSGSGQSVILQATIYKNSASAIMEFPIRIMPMSDQVLVNSVAEQLTWDVIRNNNSSSSQNYVTEDLSLPTTPTVKSGSTGWFTQPSGTNISGVSISWSQIYPSSPTYVVTSGANMGRVTRPDSDKYITLRATVEKGSGSSRVYATKEFELTIKQLTNADAVKLAAQEISWTDIRNRNTYESSVFSNLTLPSSEEKYDTTITWSSSVKSTLSDAGVVTPPSSGTVRVRLTATFSKGSGSSRATKEREFDITVVVPTAAQEVTAAAAALGWSDIKNQNSNQDAVITNLTLPDKGIYDTTITWSSSRTNTITNEGIVTAPTSGSAVSVTLTATVRKGSSTATATIVVTVKVLTNAEAVAAEKADLTWDSIRNTNTLINQVRSDLQLSSSGKNGTNISWTSSRTDVISNTGRVTRPTSNTSVTLTAVIEKGSSRDSKTFSLTVLAAGSGNIDVTETGTSMTAQVTQSDFSAQTAYGTKGVEIKSNLCTLSFDAKAAGAISTQAYGDIVIEAKKVDQSELSYTIQALVGDRGVYDFTITGGNRSITSFNGGTVTVRMPYSLRSGENANAVIVYYLDAGGNLKLTRGAYDAASRQVVFQTKHFSRFAIAYNAVSYTDVSGWYKDAVDFIAARKYPIGIYGDRFEPSKALTRGEFTAVLMNAYGIEIDMTATTNFADVDPNAAYAKHLATARKLGIVSGVGDNKYAPERVITRQEMFALLYNLLVEIDEVPQPVSTGKRLSDFSDGNAVNASLTNAIGNLLAADMMSGTDGKLLPGTYADRSQMAGMIYNLLK